MCSASVLIETVHEIRDQCLCLATQRAARRLARLASEFDFAAVAALALLVAAGHRAQFRFSEHRYAGLDATTVRATETTLLAQGRNAVNNYETLRARVDTAVHSQFWALAKPTAEHGRRRTVEEARLKTLFPFSKARVEAGLKAWDAANPEPPVSVGASATGVTRTVRASGAEGVPEMSVATSGFICHRAQSHRCPFAWRPPGASRRSTPRPILRRSAATAPFSPS